MLTLYHYALFYVVYFDVDSGDIYVTDNDEMMLLVLLKFLLKKIITVAFIILNCNYYNGVQSVYGISYIYLENQIY